MYHTIFPGNIEAFVQLFSLILHFQPPALPASIFGQSQTPLKLATEESIVANWRPLILKWPVSRGFDFGQKCWLAVQVAGSGESMKITARMLQYYQER